MMPIFFKGYGAASIIDAMGKPCEMEDCLVDKFGLIAFIGGQNGIHLGDRTESIALPVRLFLTTRSFARTSPILRNG